MIPCIDTETYITYTHKNSLFYYVTMNYHTMILTIKNDFTFLHSTSSITCLCKGQPHLRNLLLNYNTLFKNTWYKYKLHSHLPVAICNVIKWWKKKVIARDDFYENKTLPKGGRTFNKKGRGTLWSFCASARYKTYTSWTDTVSLRFSLDWSQRWLKLASSNCKMRESLYKRRPLLNG